MRRNLRMNGLGPSSVNSQLSDALAPGSMSSLAAEEMILRSKRRVGFFDKSVPVCRLSSASNSSQEQHPLLQPANKSHDESLMDCIKPREARRRARRAVKQIEISDIDDRISSSVNFQDAHKICTSPAGVEATHW